MPVIIARIIPSGILSLGPVAGSGVATPGAVVAFGFCDGFGDEDGDAPGLETIGLIDGEIEGFLLAIGVAAGDSPRFCNRYTPPITSATRTIPPTIKEATDPP